MSRILDKVHKSNAFEQFTKVRIKFPSLCCASGVAFELYNLHFYAIKRHGYCSYDNLLELAPTSAACIQCFHLFRTFLQ